MNGHTLQVFFYELRRNFRRKGYLFTTFGIPLVAIVLLLGYQFIQSRNQGDGTNAGSGGTPPTEAIEFDALRSAGYVDETGMFDDPGDLSSFLSLYPNEAAAQAALESDEIQAYYVIPADYLDTGEVLLVMPQFNLGQINEGPVRQLVLNTLSEGVDEDILLRLVDPTNIREINLALTTADDEQPQDEGVAFALVYVFALILLLSLFTTNGYLLQTVIEERETRLIEILISTVRPTQLLTGKILSLGLLGLLQIVVWIGGVYAVAQIAAGGQLGQTVGILATLANIRLPLDMLPILLVYFVLAYLLFAGLYGILGALSNSMREGPQYAAVFTLPAVIPLYFTALFASVPDGSLPTILSLIPITAPVAMSMRLAISTVPAWQIIISLALLAVTVVAVMWAAGRIFRVQILLAGQMPKLKDIPRLLRG